MKLLIMQSSTASRQSVYFNFETTARILMKYYEIGGTCSTYGGGDAILQNFSRKIWREETTSGRLIRNVITYILKKQDVMV